MKLACFAAGLRGRGQCTPLLAGGVGAGGAPVAVPAGRPSCCACPSRGLCAAEDRDARAARFGCRQESSQRGRTARAAEIDAAACGQPLGRKPPRALWRCACWVAAPAGGACRWPLACFLRSPTVDGQSIRSILDLASKHVCHDAGAGGGGSDWDEADGASSPLTALMIAADRTMVHVVGDRDGTGDDTKTLGAP